MADLIERKDARKALECRLFESYAAYVIADKAIREIPAVNRWIPCSERLPEKNEQKMLLLQSMPNQSTICNLFSIGTKCGIYGMILKRSE